MALPLLLQVLALFALPWAVDAGAKALRLEGWLSPVVLCYAAGIALGNLDLFPLDVGLTRGAQEATVTLAIPLLLISTNIPVWLRQARSVTLSFVLAMASVTAASVVTFFLFPGFRDTGWMVSGMLAGGLTGSALNLNAVGVAIDAPEPVIGLVNVADILNGAVYLLFLTSVAQRVLLRFLPAYRPTGVVDEPDRSLYGSRRGRLHKGWIFARAAGVSALIVALAAGLSLLLFGALEEAAVILGLTVLSVAGSFVPALRRLAGAYELGQYLLLVFCVAIGLEADFREILAASPEVFAYAGTLFVLGVAGHYALARAFGIDADTVLITSTAAVYGPPFIGQVAVALGNREIVFSGIVTALMGYAAGNFLGLGVAWLLHHWVP